MIWEAVKLNWLACIIWLFLMFLVPPFIVLVLNLNGFLAMVVGFVWGFVSTTFLLYRVLFKEEFCP